MPVQRRQSRAPPLGLGLHARLGERSRSASLSPIGPGDGQDKLTHVQQLSVEKGGLVW